MGNIAFSKGNPQEINQFSSASLSGFYCIYRCFIAIYHYFTAIYCYLSPFITILQRPFIAIFYSHLSLFFI